ncbi:MAG: M48 family metallopeptidase [Halieaceae bacterium]|nr:M48 family metallopeptidase [Halieaceae bacterium]
MDFYAAQDHARRSSRWLLLWFIVAVLLLIGITNVLIAMLIYFLGATTAPMAGEEAVRGFIAAFSWETFTFVCLGVVATIFLVVLFKWAQLSAGGKAVAERLGGQRILPHTDDPSQRRCLNVVEEMALAAGMPVPPVYVLAGERGINAFAAGVSPADAVIGVTQGSLENFNREQLQGVVAHEFSHILNGDMRLNIRLAALLKGITFIGDVGEVVVRGGRSHRGSLSTRSKNRLPPQAMAIGIALWLIGLLGGIFAGLIKAAVSRQRELLADASAVQFTRNPQGVADALKVIGGYPAGTNLLEPRATELSHIFFGQINQLWQLARTHPPLPDRIRRIEPHWDGQYIKVDPDKSYRGTTRDQQRREAEQAEKAEARRRQAAVLGATVAAGAALGGAAAGSIEESGSSAPDADFDSTAAGASTIPTDLAEQARDPFGAHAVVYGLLLADGFEVQEAQYALIEASGVRGLAITTRQLQPAIAGLAPVLRLSLLELALPALKCMSAQQYQGFKDTLLKITRADNQVDLYEWCLYQVVRHYLDPEFLQVTPSKPRHRKPVHVRQEYRTVVSVLAWHGHQDEDDRKAAFHRGVESVGLYNLTLQPMEECGVAEFSRAVNKLADCYPLLKPRLLKGMAKCAAHDGELTPEEVEILVAVAAVMDCPVPASIRSNPVID